MQLGLLLLPLLVSASWQPTAIASRRSIAPTRRCSFPLLAADPTHEAGPLLYLVDDQPGMRSAIERYLSDRGFRCVSYSSGSEALNAMSRAHPPPDALVTDVRMPGSIDGLDLLRTVRADARLCAMPVVLLTAKGLSADRIEGYDAGCSAYLAKPFEPEELVAVLRALTSNAMLARTANVGSEVSALRSELASMRQLLQAMLQVQMGGAPPSGEVQAAMRHLASQGDAASGGPAGSSATPGVGANALEHVPTLTRREKSVLELVGEGMLNKEIASRLEIGLRYVEKVIKRLLEKTGTSNRTALVRRALQLGFISLEPLETLEPPAARSGSVIVPAAPEARGGRLMPGRAPETTLWSDDL